MSETLVIDRLGLLLIDEVNIMTSFDKSVTSSVSQHKKIKRNAILEVALSREKEYVVLKI